MRIVLFILLGLLVSSPLADAADRPHIVFVYADDLGLGDVGCYGGTVAPTPQLDRLAREGTRFTRYYSASPICSPSRCGLITGQFPARWNLTSYLQTRAGNRQCEQADYLDPQAPCLPRILKQAGYATAHIGKWHLGGGRDVVDPPQFSAYGYTIGLGTYESPEPAAGLGLKTEPLGATLEPQQVPRHARTAWMVDQTVAFLKANSATQPCFINLWLDDPHTPWNPKNMLKGQARENLTAVLMEMDQQIGRLMDQVPANTLFIFASDNGALPTFQGVRSGGLRGSKLSLYEGGIRLPLIVRWPGQVPAGRVDEQSVLSAVDMLPTLAAIGEAPIPAGYHSDGIDISTALRGEPLTRTKPLYWEYGRNEISFKYPPVPADRSPNLALREGPWKFLIQADETNPQLYQIETDPHETTNLVTAEPEVAARMKQTLLTWRWALPTLSAKPIQP